MDVLIVHLYIQYMPWLPLNKKRMQVSYNLFSTVLLIQLCTNRLRSSPFLFTIHWAQHWFEFIQVKKKKKLDTKSYKTNIYQEERLSFIVCHSVSKQSSLLLAKCHSPLFWRLPSDPLTLPILLKLDNQSKMTTCDHDDLHTCGVLTRHCGLTCNHMMGYTTALCPSVDTGLLPRKAAVLSHSVLRASQLQYLLLVSLCRVQLFDAIDLCCTYERCN